jgi:hypothetical protein
MLPAFFLILLLSGCAVTNKFGPYRGKVIDAETQKPIEGAVVFMKCGSLLPTLAGSQYHYIEAKEVLTDSKGEFYIELRVNTLRPGHAWERPKFIIFKPGYGIYPVYPGSSADITIKDAPSFFPENTYVTIMLPPLKIREERLRNLDKIYEHSNDEIPYEKRKNLFTFVKNESVAIGLKPLPTPKQ